jgi:chromosome segregation ATPase
MQKICLIAAALLVCAQADENPLSKTIQLLDELHAKVTADGEKEAKAYKEYVEWCDDVSANTKYEIKTLTSQKDNLEARIAELASNIEAGTSKIESLAAEIATANSELNDATTIRNKEAKDFAASEAELVDAIDTLDRAVNILQREMSKNPALTQVNTKNMNAVLQSLGAIVDAAAFNSQDKQKLFALVQAHQNADADDDDAGAPAAAVYKTHSTSIFDLLEDLKEKAEGELSQLRKAETNSQHNFDMLKQSLTDQMNADTKDMDGEKSARSGAEEEKATAEGDLAQTVNDLASAEDKLAGAQHSCLSVAADHEATVASRNQELAAIEKAKQILADTTKGAVEQTYSFFQFSSGIRMRSKADLAGSEVIALVKKLAKEHHSSALAQLASKITAVVRYGSTSGDDVFGKVKQLISQLIARLESEASADATEKQYCDEQMAKTEAKKSELDDDIAKLTSKIDTNTAKSAELKAEVKELHAAVAKLMKEQADMDNLRQEQHQDFVQAKADLELGLSGVRQALGVLRDYYGSAAAMIQQPEPPKPDTFDKAQGAGDSIVGILEVVESDFAKNLVQEETAEADAQSAYDTQSQANAIEKTEKDQSIKYKSQEAASRDKAVSELSSDRATANAEYDAVMEYYGKLKERCIAKPETYEERKRRREAEIAGLKQALDILENETATFLQRKRRGLQIPLRA